MFSQAELAVSLLIFCFICFITLASTFRSLIHLTYFCVWCAAHFLREGVLCRRHRQSSAVSLCHTDCMCAGLFLGSGLCSASHLSVLVPASRAWIVMFYGQSWYPSTRCLHLGVFVRVVWTVLASLCVLTFRNKLINLYPKKPRVLLPGIALTLQVLLERDFTGLSLDVYHSTSVCRLQQHSLVCNLGMYVFLNISVSFSFFLMAAPTAYGGSQARG